MTRYPDKNNRLLAVVMFFAPKFQVSSVFEAKRIPENRKGIFTANIPNGERNHIRLQ